MPKLLFTASSLPTALCPSECKEPQGGPERSTGSQRKTAAPTSLGAPRGALSLSSKPLLQRHFPTFVHVLGYTNTRLGKRGKAELLLVLAIQPLQLELISLPPGGFPRVASGTQPRAPYKHELPAASSRPQLPPAVSAAKPGCCQPESRALFPQEALVSTFQDSALCPQHFSCSLRTLWGDSRAQAGRLWAQQNPNSGRRRETQQLFCSHVQERWKGTLPLVSLVGFLTGSEAGAAIPLLWGDQNPQNLTQRAGTA